MIQAAERHVGTFTTWFGGDVRDEHLVRRGQVAYARSGKNSGPLGAVNKAQDSTVTMKVRRHVQPKAEGSKSVAEYNV